MSCRHWSWAALLLPAALLAAPAFGQGRPPIYSCVDATGKRVTSDRMIPGCHGDQKELNSDGSVKRVLPPTLTQEERAELEQCERDAQSERARQVEAQRREVNLIKRYPTEEAHRKAREKGLDDFRQSVRLSEQRVQLLKAERKPLEDEREFYVNKPLPAKLKNALDANDAAMDAQRALIQNQQSEIVRINGVYDEELGRLRKLWKSGPTASPPIAACVVGRSGGAR